MRAIVFLFLLFGASVLGCTSNADCGGAGQEGLCFAGVCQCGVGYSGNQAIDPSVCGLTCTPPPVPDSVAFLVEPNVTVTAASGNVVLDISLDPYLKQVPTTIAFNNPTNGTACSLMPQLLGQGTWSQAIDDSAGQCLSKYLLATPFAATVGGACWDVAAPRVETGSQYSVTFNEYKTQVEVIQSGLAPFGQVAARKRQSANETTITRAFRRDYSISVATKFTATTQPFSVLKPTPIPVAPTAVNDTIVTPQNVPAGVNVLDNDLKGSDGDGGYSAFVLSTLRLLTQPQHGTVDINATSGFVTFTPANLYHGDDAFIYEICDVASLCANATVNVKVTPNGPTAVADAGRTLYEGSVEIAVLSNDIAGVGGLITLSILTDPASGTATITSNNTIIYQAPLEFVGQVSFTYQICDGSNPTVLCSSAIVLIDVGGKGPVAVPDNVTVAENSGLTIINVLSNDLNGTAPLNPASVNITSGPTSGGTATVNTATGEINFTPDTGFYGTVTLSYQVCDFAVPDPLCSSTTVTVSVTGIGPTIKDDSATTGYSTAINVAVLANDLPGAQPLNVSSLIINQGPSAPGATATVSPNGTILYVPATGFVGSDSFTYEVCDTSIPVPLCGTATVTIVVNGITGVTAIRYRLVTIDYDVRGKMIGATVQTQTPRDAKVGNIQVDLLLSTGIAPVVGVPLTGAACDPSSAAGVCDQFHIVRFTDSPCSVAGAILVLQADFLCAGGGSPNTCGYVSYPTSYQLTNLALTYDACPRVVQYGVDAAQSFLRLHEDVPRLFPVLRPQLQGSTMYGRCSIFPSQGGIFQSVTLSSLSLVEMNATGPNNLGNKLGSTYLTLLSAATSTSPSNPLWDFDLFVDPTVFLVGKVYYLEATLDLVFANTGALVRKRLLLEVGGTKGLRALGRQTGTGAALRQGVFSQTFRLSAAVSSSSTGSSTTSDPTAPTTSAPVSTTAPTSGGGDGTTAIAVAAAVVGVCVVAGLVVLAVVLRRRKKNKEEEEAKQGTAMNEITFV